MSDEKRDKDTLHFSLNGSTIEGFGHACIDENLKVASHVVEGLMLLFINDSEIRKRAKEEAIKVSRYEGAKRLLSHRNSTRKPTTLVVGGIVLHFLYLYILY